MFLIYIINPAPLFPLHVDFQWIVVIDVLNPMADLNELWIMNGYGTTPKWNDGKIYVMLKYEITLLIPLSSILSMT